MTQVRVDEKIVQVQLRGAPGPSNYELWLAAGNTGSLNDYLAYAENGLQVIANQAVVAAQALNRYADPERAKIIAEVNLTSFGAMWETEKWNLFQDAAGTVPVASTGQPVGCIKAVAGSSNYDFIMADNAKRGTYFESYGRGFVRMNAGQGYYSRANVTFRDPSFMALGGRFGGTVGRTLMGFAKNTGSLFQLNSATLGRTNASLRGSSPDLVRALANAYCPDFLAPAGPVGVYHAQLGAGGLLDSFAEDTRVLSGAGPAQVATPWVEADQVTGMSLVLNGGGQSLGIGVINTDASLDFHGGVVLGREPGNRDAIVQWLQSRTRPPVTENDEVIVVIGDSTGDNISSDGPASIQEVFYRLAAEDLVARRPSNCVLLRDWSRVGDTFQGPQRFSDGNRTKRTFLINCSSAGSQPGYFFGERFARAIGWLPKIDLVIWHHGHNLPVGDATIQADPNRGLLKAGQFIDTMDQMRAQFPRARHAIVTPYPYGAAGDARIEPVKKAIEFVAAKYPDMLTASYYAPFEAAGRPASWYLNDLVHPSVPLGVSQMYAVIQGLMTAYDALPADHYVTPALLSHRRVAPAENLLGNGSFDAWSGGVPTGWTLTGDATATKVGTLAEVTASNGGLAQTINAVPLQGKTIALTVTQRIEPDSNISAGGVRFATDVGAVGDGRWVDAPYRTWGAERAFVYLFRVPAAATTLTITLLAGLTGAGTVQLSRAVLVESDDPRDLLV
ncbi:SGNH/GDSL hydrolase family protein [Allosphingosinicella indica]|uniref:Uncharacterized protein n=1 Tax=Allosphingosinicella indica TaxID=941907 RepID=A0A1X7GJ14_9SPHN|nr:hypothetical protein [Allosphingosinicella indica]SMF70493.1 hypothetical protein SAMN06295910_1883 [Allosphingosinicella indica]